MDKLSRAVAELNACDSVGFISRWPALYLAASGVGLNSTKSLYFGPVSPKAECSKV